MAWIVKQWEDGEGARVRTPEKPAPEKLAELKAGGYEVAKYLVGYREPSGKRVHKSFRRLDDARQFRAEIERQLDNDQYTPKAERKVTLGAYIETMLVSDHGIAESTRMWYREASARVNARLGHRSIGDLSRPELQAFVNGLVSEGVGNGRLDSIRQLLVRTFTHAVNDGVLSRSPMQRVIFPKVERREVQPLDPSTVRDIADAIAPRYRAAVLLSAYAGLREGELGGLRRQDIDFPRRRITVQQAARTVGSRVELAEPKTKAAHRAITIPTFLVEELARHIERFGTADDGRLFRAPVGSARNAPADVAGYQVFGKALAQACERLEIEKPHWHDLRHTAAALAIKGGAHPKAIQARLGHSNIAVTLDTYGHLFPSLDEDLAERLDADWVSEQAEAKVIELR
jgi:integrase